MKNLFIFSLVLVSVTLAQTDPYAPFERYEFGKYLFEQGDYLRAIDEFRFSSENDTARYLAGKSLAKLGRFNESSDQLRSLVFNSGLSQHARFELYKNAWFAGDLQFLHENRSSIYFPSRFSQNVESLSRISYLLENQISMNEEEFLAPFDTEYVDTVKQFYRAVAIPKSKNPVKAAWLSAIIPGAGKIYTEDYGDGITAFLFVGVLTYLAVDNFNAGHDFRGYLFSGLSAYFYAGNIYGSYSSAQIFNVKYRINLQEKISGFLESVNYFEPGLK